MVQAAHRKQADYLDARVNLHDFQRHLEVISIAWDVVEGKCLEEGLALCKVDPCIAHARRNASPLLTYIIHSIVLACGQICCAEDTASSGTWQDTRA